MLDVSRLDASLPPASIAQVWKHYLCSAILYGLLLVFVAFNPWFRELLRVSIGNVRALDLYCGLYAAYLGLAPIVFFVFRPRSLWISKNLAIAGWFARLLRHVFVKSGVDACPLAPSDLEKHALAFLAIKLFYGPLMLNSAFVEYSGVPRLMNGLAAGLPVPYVLDLAYLLLVRFAFLLDSLLFFVGYHTEAGWLKNRLRYAETNVFRILVCILCYPPFNAVTCSFFGPSNHDPRILFHGDVTHPATWVLRGIALAALVLMTSASLSLFTKASNLTNRGIVQRGPYRLIRHPGYLGKNLFWVATLAPLFVPDFARSDFTWPRHLLLCATVAWGVLGWGTLYFLRALTEEQFLRRDPDYVEYCKRVKYRFIPGIY
jgi:protein-S-isoprenylcysteine O-methyltransferase Ste14